MIRWDEVENNAGQLAHYAKYRATAGGATATLEVEYVYHSSYRWWVKISCGVDTVAQDEAWGDVQWSNPRIDRASDVFDMARERCETLLQIAAIKEFARAHHFTINIEERIGNRTLIVEVPPPTDVKPDVV